MKLSVKSVLSRFGWLAVAGAALAISTWSLYWVGRHFGLPEPIAWLVSMSFDGAALVCADIALRYARTHGDSGLVARFFVIVFAGCSAYLNSAHAGLAGLGTPARVLFAVPPVVAVVVFEVHDRFERRTALRAAGRSAAALPAFGVWAWALFPFKTLRAVREIVEYRLGTAVSLATGELSGSVRKTLRGVSRTGSELGETLEPDHRTLRSWARGQGLPVNPTGPVRTEVVEMWHARANGSKS